MRSANFFEDVGLPMDAFLNVCRYLSPDDVMAASRLNHATGQILGRDSDLFWQAKHERHFPYIHATLAAAKDINWYAQFRRSYESEYKKLSSAQRRLFFLIKENDLARLKEYPITVKDLDAKDGRGKSLLDWMEKVSNQSVLDVIYKKIKTSIPAPDQDRFGRTRLFWLIALRQSFEKILRSFLSGSQLDEEYYPATSRTRTIHFAARKGRLDIIEKWLKAHPELLNVTDSFNCTPLMYAASKGHLPVVECLLKHGADVTVAVNKPHDRKAHGVTALHYAVESGCSEMVEMLLQAGTGMTRFVDNTQEHIVHFAVENNKLDAVKVLIENNPELLNQADVHGRTPLLLAISKARFSIAEFLLQQPNVELNAVSFGWTGWMAVNNGKTALHWAAQLWHECLVEMLVQKGADTTIAMDRMQYQAIHIAVQNNGLAAVKALIEANPTLLNAVDANGQTPLVWAAEKGFLPIVEYLLTRPGVNLNAASQGFVSKLGVNGKTALYWATQHNHPDVVAVLVRAGVGTTRQVAGKQEHIIHFAVEEDKLDVVKVLIENNPEVLNQADEHGRTPLLLAISKAHFSIAEFLLQQPNVELNAVSFGLLGDEAVNNGKTALHWAAQFGCGELIELLAQKEADMTIAMGKMQYQAIHVAVKENQLAAVKALIEANPDLLNAVDKYGKTPLMWAALRGIKPIVSYLLVQPNIEVGVASQETHGKTALHRAVQYGKLEAVVLLNEHSGKLIDLVDDDCQNPFMLAVALGRLSIVKYLLATSTVVDINAVDKHGKTALHYAAEQGWNDIVQALLRKGAKPSLDNPINKENLDAQTQAEVELLEYIPRRKEEENYKTTFTLFCHTFTFGFSRKEKVSAAKALRDVTFFGADKATLEEHKGALNNSNLNAIRQKLGVVA